MSPLFVDFRTATARATASMLDLQAASRSLTDHAEEYALALRAAECVHRQDGMSPDGTRLVGGPTRLLVRHRIPGIYRVRPLNID